MTEYSISMLFDWLTNTMQPLLTSGIGNLISLVAIIAGPAVVLYFVIWSLRQLNDERPYTELVWEFFKLSAVMSFALNVDFYMSTLIPFVINTPNQIAAAFTGSGDDTVHVLDGMFASIIEQMNVIWENTAVVKWHGLDLAALFMAGLTITVVFIMGMIYIGIASLVLFVANVVVLILVALGPIFIVAAFFRSTNNFFLLWVNQLFNYMLIFVIASLVFTVFSQLIIDVIIDHNPLNIAKIGIIFFFYIVAIGTVQVIPMLASSLSGGMGLNGVVGGTATTATMLFTKPLAGLLKQLMKGYKKNPGSGDLGKNTMKPNNKLPG